MDVLDQALHTRIDPREVEARSTTAIEREAFARVVDLLLYEIADLLRQPRRYALAECLNRFHEQRLAAREGGRERIVPGARNRIAVEPPALRETYTRVSPIAHFDRTCSWRVTRWPAVETIPAGRYDHAAIVLQLTLMSTGKRLPPAQSRATALQAARTLLIETGPQSVTLKAVAQRIGRTHANLLHHFGSAAGLQRALAGYLADMVCESIGEAVRATRASIGHPREVVDLAFDAFDREGGGALASWMLLSGNEDALDPILETIHALVDELHPAEREHGAERPMHEVTYSLVLLALGNALMGDLLANSLGVDRSGARDRAEAMLTTSMLEAADIAG